MKKIFFSCLAMVVSMGITSAQEDYMRFFPNNPGAQLVNKTYDANDNLLATTTYTVKNYYEHQDGSQIEIGYTMTDNRNRVIDEGNLEASYRNGSFYMNMHHDTLLPSLIGYLSAETELVSDLLDYPDTFVSSEYPYDAPPFRMEAGSMTIRTKKDKKDYAEVKMYERDLKGNETIDTPAGRFEASKIEYKLVLFHEGKRSEYKGTEWYSPGAGIVRSEIYDTDNRLLDYTVLTSLKR